LVVIGIIAVLIGVLLPALSRAREQSNKVACSSNLKQLATAYIMYCNDNRGMLPGPGSNANPMPEDWIYWQNTTARPFKDSRLLKYLGNISENLFRCPSDANWAKRANGSAYHYSYTVNNKLTSSSGVGNIIGTRAMKLSNVRNSTQKVLLIEEDDSSIDDASAKIDGTSPPNTISVRHDRQHKYPEDLSKTPIPNLDRFGMVVYCDGHSDAMTRKMLLEQATVGNTKVLKYVDPWWPGTPKQVPP